ncbi:hypothetical protein [Solicola sp. PLA-1-18]|uniref:hypothetical protein n=1 Tax=Solicola sp. PLA-1-18 TaxID=3380532 RepID=UPI003B7757F6
MRSLWPASPSRRWTLRAALAAPLAVAAWWASHQGFVSAANERFALHAEALVAGGADLSGLGWAYPPLPTLAAAALPGGALSLSLVACLLAAFALQRVWALLVQRDLPHLLVGALLATVFAVPAVAYVASQSMAAIGSLALLTVALEGVAWFTLARQTEAGFMVGLALAGAFLFDPLAIFFAIAVAAMSVLIARDRFRDEPGAATATVAVMVFPVMFLAVAWSFLQWQFTGSALGWVLLTDDALQFTHGVVGGLGIAAAEVGLTVLVSPLFVVVALLYWRQPLTVLAQLVVVPVMVMALWFQLPLTAVSVYLLCTLVALTHVPRDLTRRLQVLIGVVALVQVAAVWAVPPVSDGFEQWLAVLGAS